MSYHMQQLVRPRIRTGIKSRLDKMCAQILDDCLHARFVVEPITNLRIAALSVGLRSVRNKQNNFRPVNASSKHMTCAHSTA